MFKNPLAVSSLLLSLQYFNISVSINSASIDFIRATCPTTIAFAKLVPFTIVLFNLLSMVSTSSAKATTSVSLQ